MRWHFIGSLQSNKINQLLLVKNLVSIHSIDRLSLLTKLLKKEIKNPIGLFLQVNTSGEKEISGFVDIDDICAAVDLIKGQDKFYFQGFMTIGKIRTDNFEQDARSCFQKLRELKVDFPEAELSMGMSSDYLIAKEFETDWVRVGSSIFGTRN